MLERFIEKACRFVADRLPYRVFPRPDGSPYLVRYYLVGRPGDHDEKPNRRKVFLHLFLSGDMEQELHNHPWKDAFSLILTGGYREERRIGNKVVTRDVKPLSINVIKHDDFHRVDLLKDQAWTLFFVGPVVKSWGFWNRVTREYIPWREQVFLRRPRTFAMMA